MNLRFCQFSYLFLTLSTVLFMSVSDLEAQVNAVNPNYDFGEIEESFIPYTHTFHVSNTGSTIAKIKDVKSTCGCTVVSWSQNEVASGGLAAIKVALNTMNRPGSFDKKIKVEMEDGALIDFSIKGFVRSKQRKLSDKYPYRFGQLLSEHRIIDFGLLKNNESKQIKVSLHNDSDKTIRILRFEKPSFITIVVPDKSIRPNESIDLLITYDAQNVNDLGRLLHGIEIYTSQVENQSLYLETQAIVEEYFDMNKISDKSSHPMASFSPEYLNLKTLEKDTIVTTILSLRNTGDRKLKIRKVKTSDNTLKVVVPKYELAPGQIISIDVLLNTKSMRGSFYKTIEIHTNDFEKPTTKVILKGEVKDE